jgi:hypothetical protein
MPSCILDDLTSDSLCSALMSFHLLLLRKFQLFVLAIKHVLVLRFRWHSDAAKVSRARAGPVDARLEGTSSSALSCWYTLPPSLLFPC